MVTPDTPDLGARVQVLEGRLDDLQRVLTRYGTDSMGHRRQHGSDSHLPSNNMAAAVAPGAADDSTYGYGVGSFWLDTTNNKAYLCLSAAARAAVWHQIDVGGAMKTSGAGYFLIPAGPADNTGVTSGAADTYGSYTQMIASTAAAIYIVGLVFKVTATIATYGQIMLGTGGTGAETGVGEWKVGLSGSSTAAFSNEQYVLFPFPIPVATSTRIAAKTADNVGSLTWGVSLICINQANVVPV